MTSRRGLLASTLIALLLASGIDAAFSEEPVWTVGEVREVDTEQGKVTVHHEDIVNLDMPEMTMVFPVTDPALLEGLEAGDVREFYFAEENGRFVIMQIREQE